MAVQTPPYALQASSHSAELFRRAVNSLIIGTGVIGGLDLKVTQNTGTDLKCQVAAGQIWIPGTLGSTNGMHANASPQGNYSPGSPTFTSQGCYYGYNDAAITALTFSPANVTNPRIDLVVATVQDAGYAGGTNNWVIQVVTGTAAGSPVAPVTPANTVVLAQVAIAANATAVVNANITDQRPFVSAGLYASNIVDAFIATTETTTSNSPTDLATVGPQATVVIPTSGRILVTLSSACAPAASNYCQMYYTMSGANTAAAGANSLSLNFGSGTGSCTVSSPPFLLTGLNPGATTFTAKYASTGGTTAQFSSRHMLLQVLP